MKLVLIGRPLSTNHLYKSACRGRHPTVYLTPEGKQLKFAYQMMAKAQWKGKPLEGDELDVWVTLYFPTKARTDVANYEKLALDALSGVVYRDDSQIAHLHLERAFSKENPRIEIEII